MCCSPVERSQMNKSMPTAFRCTPSGRKCWVETEGHFRTALPAAMQFERAWRCKSEDMHIFVCTITCQLSSVQARSGQKTRMSAALFNIRLRVLVPDVVMDTSFNCVCCFHNIIQFFLLVKAEIDSFTHVCYNFCNLQFFTYSSWIRKKSH